MALSFEFRVSSSLFCAFFCGFIFFYFFHFAPFYRKKNLNSFSNQFWNRTKYISQWPFFTSFHLYLLFVVQRSMWIIIKKNTVKFHNRTRFVDSFMWISIFFLFTSSSSFFVFYRLFSVHEPRDPHRAYIRLMIFNFRW